jgi:L-iditol 2-dehydrogenase
VGVTPGYPGGFAEQLALPGEVLMNGIVHLMPPGMSFTHAALSEPLSSVLAAHEKIGTDLEDTLLILGGGPIGCLHIAIAKERGARVILSEPNPIRRRLAEPFHPDFILDPSQVDVAGEVRLLTGGRGADAVICANPVAACQAQAVDTVRKGGKVVLFGGLPKASPMTTLDGNRIHYGEICVVGSFSYRPSFHELALEVIRRGSIQADLVITHLFSLDQASLAFEAASQGEALKVMLTMELDDRQKNPGIILLSEV